MTPETFWLIGVIGFVILILGFAAYSHVSFWRLERKRQLAYDAWLKSLRDRLDTPKQHR